ncbi:FmdB family transcriptional regulator [Horticoccus luteus]|uniref:FmdB family transcriptional regulator n=2 Tax=Horticoccus luteus TaxID=2862869 RepID=A0A8F9XFZ3_9BACT|nr:FmdB family transcriptional regulator [Horticoccus luteus]
MPIYEYYCPDNHTIYQFFAKTLAQGQTVPKCPENPKFRMRKIVSAFAINTGGKRIEDGTNPDPSAAFGGGEQGDPRMDAAMGAMEKEFANVDENDPRAMGRMMRRMAELTGEKIDGEMEEVVRKLEEGADPDSLEEQLGGPPEGEGGMDDPYGSSGPGEAAKDPREPRHRFRLRRQAPTRDPQLYDYA